MEQVIDEPEVRVDIVEAMRDLADQGKGVRELVQVVQSQLSLKHDVFLPVLWYFMKAFHLPLAEVLPIREWLGTDNNDEEIDAVILPAIRRAKDRLALLQAANEGKLDGLPCPRCKAPKVSVWFTRPAENEYRTWFICDRCGFEMRAQNTGRPIHYSEDRDLGRRDSASHPGLIATEHRS